MTEKALEKEQAVSMIDFNSTVMELTKVAQQKKDDLGHQIVLATTRLRQLNEQQVKEQQAFDQWKRSETQKFDNEMSKRSNEMIDKQNRLNLLVQDIERRSLDLRVKEERAIQAQEMLTKLNDERVEVEKLRVRAHNLMQEAELRMTQAVSKESDINSKLEEAKKINEEAQKTNAYASHLLDQAKSQQKVLAEEKGNLEKLHEYVDPKIKEIKEIQEDIDAKKKDIDEKHRDINNKIEEEQILLRGIDDRKAKLDKIENDLKSRELELKRKIIQLENRK